MWKRLQLWHSSAICPVYKGNKEQGASWGTQEGFTVEVTVLIKKRGSRVGQVPPHRPTEWSPPKKPAITPALGCGGLADRFLVPKAYSPTRLCYAPMPSTPGWLVLILLTRMSPPCLKAGYAFPPGSPHSSPYFNWILDRLSLMGVEAFNA